MREVGEVWLDEKDVLEEGAETERVKKIEAGSKKKSKKRKMDGEGGDEGSKRSQKKIKAGDAVKTGDAVKPKAESALRKEKLKQQKAEVMADI